MTNELRFDLAAALSMADHAASSGHFIGPLNNGRMSPGPARHWPAEPDHRLPAVLLVTDNDVYLISNGSPSQIVDGRHVIAYALGDEAAASADHVRQAAGLAPGMWLNYPLPAQGGWVDLARHALNDGHHHLVIDLSDFSVSTARDSGHSGDSPA